jgi:hypothetical protein
MRVLVGAASGVVVEVELDMAQVKILCNVRWGGVMRTRGAERGCERINRKDSNNDGLKGNANCLRSIGREIM